MTDTSPTTTPPVPEETSPAEAKTPARRAVQGLDLWLILALFVAALPLRLAGTRGDLWLDEADYAFAAIRGFQANRWDASNVPADPDKLVRSRHYHPPLVAYAIEITLPWGTGERALRLLPVLVGSLSVVLVYLCGLVLFTGRRSVALACAGLMIVTPADIRAASHALPWVYIVFWLLAMLWTLLQYAETRREGWLIGAWAALGGMFITSEMFFPTLLAAGASAPFLLRPDLQDPARRRRLLRALGLGLLAFLAIAAAFWPAGLLGGAVRMLQHYMAMAHDPWPVYLHGRNYDRAPKWAYLYWYARYFTPFFLVYALGGLAALGLLAQRKVSPAVAVLLIFTLVLLFTAHRAHIIGPAYLVDALPFLTLLAGLFFLEILRRSRELGFGVMAAACLVTTLYPPPLDLLQMEPRTLQSRWPEAARFLAARWHPGDSMLAPAYGTPARWYLLHAPGARLQEWQVQALPAANANPRLLDEIVRGHYRYIAVGNPFGATPNVDPRILQIVRSWPVIWRSPEDGTGPSRLVIYQLPPGVSSRTPLPLPPAPL